MSALARTISAAAVAAAACSMAHAQDDSDALSLGSAPEAAAKPADRSLRLFVEGAAGPLSQRFGLPSETASRLSVDLNWDSRPAPQWRVVLSDRLDDVHPPGTGSRSTLNSLREAYVSRQDESGQMVVDFGRINLRNGPAYGYNPTDYFRDGALRAYTTPDPLSLRDNRLGTVMLRAQRLWTGGSATFAFAPRLDDAPDTGSFAADLGATNSREKVLLAIGAQPTDTISAQVLAFAAQGQGRQIGANLSALLSDSAVAFAEWSGGRVAFPQTAGSGWRNRTAAGLTYSGPARIALTAEVEYNGGAVDRQVWDALAAAGTLGDYLVEAQRRQDNAARWSTLVYLSQQGGITKQLDLTALLRVNGDDHSRFGWLEMRYHWPHVDLALQWQRSSGAAVSEYGASTTRQIVQLLAAYYF